MELNRFGVYILSILNINKIIYIIDLNEYIIFYF
jgi:hypothetical protein